MPYIINLPGLLPVLTVVSTYLFGLPPVSPVSHRFLRPFFSCSRPMFFTSLFFSLPAFSASPAFLPPQPPAISRAPSPHRPRAVSPSRPVLSCLSVGFHCRVHATLRRHRSTYIFHRLELN